MSESSSQTLTFSCPQTGIYTVGTSGSQVFGLRLELTTGFLGLKCLADGRLRDLSASVIM